MLVTPRYRDTDRSCSCSSSGNRYSSASIRNGWPVRQIMYSRPLWYCMILLAMCISKPKQFKHLRRDTACHSPNVRQRYSTSLMPSATACPLVSHLPDWAVLLAIPKPHLANPPTTHQKKMCHPQFFIRRIPPVALRVPIRLHHNQHSTPTTPHLPSLPHPDSRPHPPHSRSSPPPAVPPPH